MWHDVHYHPEKLLAVLSFQAGVFLLFLLQDLAAQLLRRRKAGIENLVRLVLNAAFFFGALYTLLDADYHVWMGSLAMAMAVIYAMLAAIVFRASTHDDRHFVVAVAVALGFVAMVFPLETDAVWISLGWAAEGFVLWWFGLRVRMPALRGLAAALLLLAVGRLLFVDTPGGHAELFLPVLNRYGLPALGVAAALLATAAAGGRFAERLRLPGKVAVWLTGLGGLLLVWFVLSLETYNYFAVQISHQPPAYTAAGQRIVDPSGQFLGDIEARHAVALRRMAQTGLSLLWAVYAAVVLALGFLLRNRPVRWLALGLFALTMAKVLVVDMSGLPGFYRVATLFVLAVMTGVAAWAYQRWQADFHRKEGR